MIKLCQKGTAIATDPGPVQLCAERADAVSLGKVEWTTLHGFPWANSP